MRVERDAAFADLTLHAALRRGTLGRRDRALATELVYGTLRLRGRIDYVLERVLERDLDKTGIGVRNLLRLGTYQLLFTGGIRPAAAVSEAVEIAKGAKLGRAAGFVNAILRQVSKRARTIRFPDLEEDPLGYLVHWGSLPPWLAERWLDGLGAVEAAALAEALVLPPPRTVRVRDPARVAEIARRLGGRRCRHAPAGVTDCKLDPVHAPGFDRGEFVVQDEASQLVPLLLGAAPGETVVDCCAAPGSKALQLAEAVGPDGEVIALDVHARRLSLVRREARRLGLANVRTLERDAIQGFDLRGRQRFPRILVDAPCTGLGVLRRNPDARWRLEPGDLGRLAAIQLRLLASAVRYLDNGGVLVYSVCSTDPEETEQVVSRFLESETKLVRDDPRPFLPEAARELVGPDGALRTWPHRHGCDGFYAVRLVRS